MKYESSILKRLIDTYGVIGNPRYLSEIIKEFIVRGKELYPQLFTYQADWLAHIDEFGLTPDYVVSYTGQQIYTPHTKERPVKRAILKGCTGYRDIDTGEILETFEEGRNLELVSVKMPVLTTSNEDGTKTNILTVNEDITLRGIGDVQDTLDCLTGEAVERIGEIVLNEDITGYQDTNYSVNGYSAFRVTSITNIPNTLKNVICDKVKYYPNFGLDWTKQEEFFTSNGNLLFIKILSTKASNFEELRTFLSSSPITIQYELTESIKTVDLTIKDQNDFEVSQLSSFNGGTHFSTSSQEGYLLPTIIVDVVTDLEETLNLCSMDGNTL